MITVPPPRPTPLARPSDDELRLRQQRAVEAAQRAGLAGLIVWGRGSTNADGCADLLYLTNHLSAVSHIPDSEANSARGHAALVLAPGREPVLVTDSYDIDRSEVGVHDIRLSTYVDRDCAQVAIELGLQAKSIGVAGQTGLLHSAAVRMAEVLGPSTTLIPSDGLLTDLRVIKSEHEVALLRDASRIGSEWMQAVLAAAIPGRTEGEIVGEGLRWLSAAGGWAYDVAVASGPCSHRYRHRQALPTWDVHRQLEEGDLFHVDLWGPMAHGYFCDLTRSTVIGAEPTDSQRRVLEDSIELVEQVIARIEPGVPLSALRAVGVEVMDRRGGGSSAFSAMIPFVGHSLGLECEAPFITSFADRVIEPHMVFAIECFLGGESGQGAGFEHVLHVGEREIEILTALAPTRPWEQG